MESGGGTTARLDAIWRAESRRVLATLIRLLGDFDLAEEALQEAFAAAVERWPQEGVPASPRAWLVSAGRFRAVDALRRRATLARKQEELAALADVETQLAHAAPPDAALDAPDVEDDRLRLVFTCCHPAMAEGLARVAPSPVVALNRAVAVAMAEGPARGLPLLEALAAGGALRGYHLLPAARADLLRRLGRREEAAAQYRAALALTALAPERRFLERRLRGVEGNG